MCDSSWAWSTFLLSGDADAVPVDEPGAAIACFADQDAANETRQCQHVEKSPTMAAGRCLGSWTTFAINVRCHRSWMSSWHSRQARDPTNVFVGS